MNFKRLEERKEKHQQRRSDLVQELQRINAQITKLRDQAQRVITEVNAVDGRMAELTELESETSEESSD